MPNWNSIKDSRDKNRKTKIVVLRSKRKNLRGERA
jgi:hypothetical protein